MGIIEPLASLKLTEEGRRRFADIVDDAVFSGSSYQKKFIAYLSLETILETQPVKGISCKDTHSIIVDDGSKLIYYEIKDTTEISLAKSNILDGIKLFSSIESTAHKMRYGEYVLVSSTGIQRINDEMVRHPIVQVGDDIKNAVIARTPELAERMYIMKTPAADDIIEDITSRIVMSLKDRRYEYDIFGIKKDLFSYVNKMCPSVDNEKTTSEIEKGRSGLEGSTITSQTIKTIIKKNL
jgi:hypothetical protein